MSIILRASDALLVVDVQNDFCPGGALAVADGDAVVPVINGLMPRFPLVVASRDWHPPHHCSFRERGGPWPPHCVQGSKGAEYHADLSVSEVDVTLQKGADPNRDAYSAFDGTGLEQWLQQQGVERVFVTGLATDYCVRATALDACQAGLRTCVILDAVRGVDVEPGDSERALREIEEAGGKLVASDDLIGVA